MLTSTISPTAGVTVMVRYAKIKSEYGKEGVSNLRWWEKLEMKMADFKNPRRFTLRCLCQGLVPVSIKPKSTVKTPKGTYIVRKAEKMLMNERVRAINKSITMFNCQIDTCINNLEKLLEKEVLEECHRFIVERREKRHIQTQKRQIEKFKRLWQRKSGGHSNLKHGRRGEGSSENNSKQDQEKGKKSNLGNKNTSEKNSQQQQQQQEKKWVHNLSNTTLREVQEKVLAHGPNFAVVANEPPIGKYIAQIERMCQKMEQGEAEELRGQIKLILKNITPPKPNISKEAAKAIKELRRDQEKVILTADKGVSMVVMEKKEYIRKSEDLLNQSTYIALTTDPTNKCKNKLINLLKTLKAEGGIDNNTYKRLYPTGAVPPKYYGLPKIHKKGTPLRPIISSRASATYETAKELAKILKPLIGKSPHHVYNNKDFLESIKDIKEEEDECIMTYDVSELFTSIPIDTTINIIKKQQEDDKDLHSRTNMTIKHICCLLEFCLKNTYFKFNGEFYEQKEGAAVGSPISPIVANLFMGGSGNQGYQDIHNTTKNMEKICR